jgi:hypothetical protein
MPDAGGPVVVRVRVPKFKSLRDWVFVMIAGLVLAVLALIDRGGIEAGPTVAAGSTGCQLQVVTDQLNVRAGPSQNAEMLGVLTRGDQVDGTAIVTDGYRQLEAGRWVLTQFLTPLPGSNCG